MTYNMQQMLYDANLPGLTYAQAMELKQDFQIVDTNADGYLGKEEL